MQHDGDALRRQVRVGGQQRRQRLPEQQPGRPQRLRRVHPGAGTRGPDVLPAVGELGRRLPAQPAWASRSTAAARPASSPIRRGRRPAAGATTATSARKAATTAASAAASGSSAVTAPSLPMQGPRAAPGRGRWTRPSAQRGPDSAGAADHAVGPGQLHGGRRRQVVDGGQPGVLHRVGGAMTTAAASSPSTPLDTAAATAACSADSCSEGSDDGRGQVGAPVGVADRRALGGPGAAAGRPGQRDELRVLRVQLGAAVGLPRGRPSAACPAPGRSLGGLSVVRPRLGPADQHVSIRLRRPPVLSATSRSPPTTAAAPSIGTRPSSRASSPPTVSTSSSSGSSTSNSSARSSTGSRAVTRTEPSASPSTGGRYGVVLVGDLADDLLEDVLDRHQAGEAAVLVDDDRHVGARGLHLPQQLVDRLGLRHEGRRRACSSSTWAAAAVAEVLRRGGRGP